MTLCYYAVVEDDVIVQSSTGNRSLSLEGERGEGNSVACNRQVHLYSQEIISYFYNGTEPVDNVFLFMSSHLYSVLFSF